MKSPTSGPITCSRGRVIGAITCVSISPRTQRRRHLESDEARADNDGSGAGRQCRDDGPAVGEGPEIVDPRARGPRNGEPDRFGASRYEQGAVRQRRAIVQRHRSCGGIERRDAPVEPQINGVVGVELAVFEWHPVFGCGACEVILRQVRPIARWISVRADHRDVAVVAFASQYVRRGKTGRATADDDDRRWRGAEAEARFFPAAGSFSRTISRSPSRSTRQHGLDPARARAPAHRCAD